jgi:hypothetical protein
MDVANKMFTEIHEFYRGYDSHWLTIYTYSVWVGICG